MGATEPPANGREHWAFHQPRKVALPPVERADWVKTDIDRFILAKLEAAKIQPAQSADARTLIRRMSLDLTGLPPTSTEASEFENACASDRTAAISALVERLLASPRYGERWGRHWLDVARYSDTKGYVYTREERRFAHAPTYRNWVIDAFNSDLPYDRFLLLQLAADQLVAADSHDLAAMGFITGGRRFIGVRHDIIDDRIDVVTRGTMALTVQCARCHDHKYDPISTEDYYSLYGVFHGGEDRLIELAAVNDAQLADHKLKLAKTMKTRRDEASARLRARIADYLIAQTELKKYPEEGFDQILGADELVPASVRHWRNFLHTAKSHPIFAPWVALVNPGADSKATLNPLIAKAFTTPPADATEAARRYEQVFAEAEKSDEPGAAELRAFLTAPNSPTVVPDTGIVNNDQFFPFTAIEELWKLQANVEKRLIELGTRAALIVADLTPEPNPRVFKRGVASRLGSEVPRQFLEVLTGEKRTPFQNGSGRLELARAIANKDNPLTARVMVNRIWQHHFGTGLVKTPSDFGVRAESPSHPELLDWLALRFVAEDWSVKAMHRLILTSAVYQQASGATEPPLLAGFPSQRLGFEQLRDSMLAVSGELDLSTREKSAALLDSANIRRTVYSTVDRQFLAGTLRTFDFANPDMHVAVRHETTVPQQALFFLNGAFAASRARALAARLAGTPEERVQQLHRIVYQREASALEVEAASKFVSESTIALPPSPALQETQWRYGYGSRNRHTKRLEFFTPLPHFTGTAWQSSEAWPGGETVWGQLTAEGGHPGVQRKFAVVRRWIAPLDCTVNVSGTITHKPTRGDGVRAFIVSSRHGELKFATALSSSVELSATGVELKVGDAIDFIVDLNGTIDSDQFLWSPIVEIGEVVHNARAEFSGPAAESSYLTPWEQYAQVLLLANEFAFTD